MEVKARKRHIRVKYCDILKLFVYFDVKTGEIIIENYTNVCHTENRNE